VAAASDGSHVDRGKALAETAVKCIKITITISIAQQRKVSLNAPRQPAHHDEPSNLQSGDPNSGSTNNAPKMLICLNSDKDVSVSPAPPVE
jgi:hypothetical protein